MRDDAGIGCGGAICKLLQHLSFCRFRQPLTRTGEFDLVLVRIAEHVERALRSAVERISISQSLQPRDSGDVRLAQIVEAPDAVLAFGKYFLHFTQPLLRLWH